MKITHVMAKLTVNPVAWTSLLLAVALSATCTATRAAGNEKMAAALHDAARYSHAGAGYESDFGRAMWLESESADGTAAGTVEAVLEFPFAAASEQLGRPASWCEILILHFNVKSCAVVERADEAVLEVGIGRKYEQSAGKVYRVSFVFGVVENRDDLLHVQLLAKNGPLGTRNYRIVVLASPFGSGKFVVKLSYAYDYGMLGKLAMETYLGTVGRNKVGFTIEGEDPDGQPRFVRGMRGAVERNAMRYCLAVESFMRSLSWPQHQQVEARLQDWFASSQHFSHQLYEMDRDTYLTIKRKEIARQQASSMSGVGG